MRISKISVLLAATAAIMATSIPLAAVAAVAPAKPVTLTCKLPAVLTDVLDPKTKMPTGKKKCAAPVVKPDLECTPPAKAVSHVKMRKETKAEEAAEAPGIEKEDAKGKYKDMVPWLDKNGKQQMVTTCVTVAPKKPKVCPKGTSLVGNNCKTTPKPKTP